MYSLPTQVQIILASMAIHNFIRRDQPDERIFAKSINPAEYTFEDLEDEDPEQVDREDDLASGEGVPNDEHDADMDDVRNNIRTQLRRLRRDRGMRRSLVSWRPTKDTGTIKKIFAEGGEDVETTRNTSTEPTLHSVALLREPSVLGRTDSQLWLVCHGILNECRCKYFCEAFHNFIRRDSDPEEDMFPPVERQAEYTFEDLPDANPNLEDLEDTRDRSRNSPQ
ncbi:hypothetical protein Vadar_003037 [Vaccinium darrowii]|uniref:Uncharacterized protein n=1 Tax=Vaccinium darrowii TaxID=229202 RepID=A0ACB7WXH4_9ERIC|nr:hypothetical protein Vadar_003037 [Vaccinium darrowii]